MYHIAEVFVPCQKQAAFFSGNCQNFFIGSTGTNLRNCFDIMTL